MVKIGMETGVCVCVLVSCGCCGGFLMVFVVAVVFGECLVHLDMGWWVLIWV